ncbi:MAG: VOC family protein [Pyrinomonadaceae bacterium]|nr:VOC family protein [Sphingobacteriaceae bacterium]
MDTYITPSTTRIGHVHLKVLDLERSLAFYQELLGFEITQRYGDGAVFLSAGGYHHHIALNTWQSKGAEKAPVRAAGLYHVAIVYAERKELADVVKRLLDNEYPLSGAADHGVSEAIYLDDPDGNGIELCWDKPKEEWPLDESGNLQMITAPLNIHGLISKAN